MFWALPSGILDFGTGWTRCEVGHNQSRISTWEIHSIGCLTFVSSEVFSITSTVDDHVPFSSMISTIGPIYNQFTECAPIRDLHCDISTTILGGVAFPSNDPFAFVNFFIGSHRQSGFISVGRCCSPRFRYTDFGIAQMRESQLEKVKKMSPKWLKIMESVSSPKERGKDLDSPCCEIWSCLEYYFAISRLLSYL